MRTVKYRWDKKYLYWGVTAFLVIISSITFFWLLNRWPFLKSTLKVVFNALNPILYGLVFAYLLNNIMTFFERRMFSKAGARLFPKDAVRAGKAARIMSILLTLALFLSVVFGLLAIALPQLFFSIEKLVDMMPEYVSAAGNLIENMLKDNEELENMAVNLLGNISEYFTNWATTTLLPRLDTYIANITGGVISFFTVIVNMFIGIVVSIYVMYNKEKFGAECKKVLYSVFSPKSVKNILDRIMHIHRTFGGFLSGKILDSFIIGVLCYIGMLLLNIPYSILVSVIVGVTNMIPVFGPFIGAIPSAFIIFLESPVKCLVFAVFILVLQQFDGNILGPKILGNRTGLSGLWVMLSILLFGKLFGFVGMLLGVPIFAVIYDMVKGFCDRRLKNKNIPFETEVLKNVAYIDPETNNPVYKTISEDEDSDA